ncbi:MAG TPA: hypothetical protein DCL44_00755 [Elusimicrobia bacterium]|nr:hypothetical protein [Elusimicrobiota bacterium]
MKQKNIAALSVSYIFAFALFAGAQAETQVPAQASIQVPAGKNTATPKKTPAGQKNQLTTAKKDEVKSNTGQAKDNAPAAAKADQNVPAARKAAVVAAPVVNPFEEAVSKLGAKDPGVRRQGADFLSQSRDQKAKPYLIAALKDENTQVRVAAVDGLGMLSAREAVPQLSEILSTDTEPAVRQAAAVSLSYIMDAASGPALLKALQDVSSSVKYAAAHTLGAMKYGPAEDPLISMLTDADAGARRVAVSALGDLQSKKAAPALAKLLTNDDKYTRLEVVRALGNIGEKAAVEELKKTLDPKEDPVVRVETALSLSKLDDPSGLDTAFEFIKSPDLSLKSQALNAIGSVGNQRSLDIIEEMYAAEQNPANKRMLDFTRQRLAARLKPGK